MRFPPLAVLAAVDQAAATLGLSRARFLAEANIDPSGFNPGKLAGRKRGRKGISLETIARIEQAHALPTAWLLLRAEELTAEART